MQENSVLVPWADTWSIIPSTTFIHCSMA